jgi:amino acid permease
MSIPSLIFWLIFVIPLVGLLIWVMRQDKRKGITGLVVLAVIVIVAIVYMYVRTGGK